MTKFLVTYEIDDGYVGQARPRTFLVSAGAIDEEMTDKEIEEMIYDLALEDMHQKIGINVRNAKEFVAWARLKTS